MEEETAKTARDLLKVIRIYERFKEDLTKIDITGRFRITGESGTIRSTESAALEDGDEINEKIISVITTVVDSRLVDIKKELEDL